MTKKSDSTEHFEQVCVWYDWIGYMYNYRGPPESMDNGCWRVGSGEIGPQRYFNVIT